MQKSESERVVKVVPIPEDIYDKISEHADKEGLSVMGVTSRALLDYIDKHVDESPLKNARKNKIMHDL